MDIEMNHPASKEEQAVERISLTTSTFRIGPVAGGGSETGLERGFEKGHDLVRSPSTKKDINGHKSLKSMNNVMLYSPKLIPMQDPPSLQRLGVAVYKSNKNTHQPEEHKSELASMLETATALGEALKSFSPAGRKTNKFRAMRRNSFVVHHKPGQMCLPLAPRLDQCLYVERSQPCRRGIDSSPLGYPATHFVPEQKSRKFRAMRRNSIVIHQKPGQVVGLEEGPKNNNCAQPACTSNQKSFFVRVNDKGSIQIQTNDEQPQSPS